LRRLHTPHWRWRLQSARDPRIAYIDSVSGSSIPLWQQELYRVTAMMDLYGYPRDDIDAAEDFGDSRSESCWRPDRVVPPKAVPDAMMAALPKHRDHGFVELPGADHSMMAPARAEGRIVCQLVMPEYLTRLTEWVANRE
jgi:hypothetical protein